MSDVGAVAVSAQDLLGESDIQTKVVRVPGWKTPVRIRGLTSQQALELGDRMRTMKKGKKDQLDDKTFQRWVIIYGCVTESGDPLFGAQHLEALAAKSAGAISYLAGQILELSGMTDKAIEAAAETIESDPS